MLLQSCQGVRARLVEKDLAPKVNYIAGCTIYAVKSQKIENKSCVLHFFHKKNVVLAVGSTCP
jgi:hypothetical protein